MTQLALTVDVAKTTNVDPAVVEFPRVDGPQNANVTILALSAEVENVRNEIAENGAGGLQTEIGCNAEPASSRVVAKSKRAECMGSASGRKWSAREQDQIRMGWGIHNLREIAAQIGRTPRAVWNIGLRIGLRGGCPQGWETLTAAAKRTGFELPTLRQLLHAAHVAIRPGMSRDTAKGRLRIVEPHDVDEAVAKWCRAETVQHAARRTGIPAMTLRLALSSAVARGELTRPASRRHWRLDPAVIDAVIAARWGVRETLRHASLRTAVDACALRRWLLAAGFTQPKADRFWRLDPADVDRVIAEKRASSPHLFQRTKRTKTRRGERNVH